MLPWRSRYQVLGAAGSSTPQLFLGSCALVYHLLGIWHLGPSRTSIEMPQGLGLFFLSSLSPPSPWSPPQAAGLLPSLSSVFFPFRFPVSADPGQRDPGSELLLWLHPDEAAAFLRPGRGQPRGQAHRAPPPHGLQSQCHCLLLLYLLLRG